MVLCEVAAWHYTAMDRCPCTSPSVWLFSSSCTHPAGPQSDTNTLFFPCISLCTQHRVFIPISYPISFYPSLFHSCRLFLLQSCLLQGTLRRTQKAAFGVYLCTNAAFDLFPPLSKLVSVNCMCMCNLSSFAGHLSFSLQSNHA